MKQRKQSIRNSSRSLLIVLSAIIYLTGCRRPVRSSDTSHPVASGPSFNDLTPPPLSWKTMLKKTIDYEKTREILQNMMKEHGVIALSIAIGDRNRETILINLGNIDASRKPVTDKTVFQAGRISQPIFGWLVMKLVDEGVFDLDRPIVQYLKKPLSGYPGYKELDGDPRCQHLTGRLILSHQSGLAVLNKSNQSQPIKFIRAPGKQFGFSDAAYRLLQLAVEESTGKKINDLAKEKVFSKLSMANTSFVRELRFKNDIAVNQDNNHDLMITDDQNNADVATSLYTTPQDLMAFLWKIAYPTTEMSMENYDLYIQKITDIHTDSINSDVIIQKGIRGLGWSLGWGKYTPREGYISFHGGKESGYENFAALYVMTTFNCYKAIVILSETSGNSKTFMSRILDELMGDTFSPLEWMGFK